MSAAAKAKALENFVPPPWEEPEGVKRPAASEPGEKVLKRPAAWHSLDEGEEQEEEAEKAEEANDPDDAAAKGDDEDMPDGVVDARPCSRRQRYMFTACRHMLDAEVVARFDELANPKTVKPGKQAEMNTIINATISRAGDKRGKASASIAVKQSTIQKIFTQKKVNTDTKAAEGYEWYSMVGSHFAGSEALAQKAWDANEIKFNKKTGKYYISKHTQSESDIMEKGFRSTAEFGDADPKMLVNLMNDLSAELHDDEEGIDNSWVKAADKKIPKRECDEAAGDAEHLLMTDFNKTFTCDFFVIFGYFL